MNIYYHCGMVDILVLVGLRDWDSGRIRMGAEQQLSVYPGLDPSVPRTDA